MNPTNRNIRDFLQYYCEQNRPLQYAVLIGGAWGSGKTHLVKSFLHAHSEIETLYVSLYGMKDISEIEDTFFTQLHPILSRKGMRIAGALVKSLVRGGLKLDLDVLSNVKVGADGSGLNVGIPEFLKKATGRVLIFDDIERSEMPIMKLLGYINGFVEHDDAKVILIANENEIPNEQIDAYKKTKEKLVGKSFKIEVDFEAALQEFIKALESNDVIKFLNAKRTKLEAIFRQSQTDNLRILQQSLYDFERLALQLDLAQRKNSEALDAICGPFLSLFFELRAARLSPEDLDGFDMGTWAEYFRKQKGERSRRDELRERYPEIKFEDSVIGIDILRDVLFKSAINGPLLRERVAQSPFFASPKDVPSWNVLWHHFSYSNSDVEAAFLDVEAKFGAREYTEAGVILHVFGLRLWLAKIGKIRQSLGIVEQECRAYVEDLLLAKRLPLADNGRFPEFESGYGGLGFHEDSSQPFIRLREFLQKRRKRALEESLPAAATQLIEKVILSPDDFFRSLTSGQHGAGTYAHVPLLQHSDPEKFVEKLLGLSKDQMRTVLVVFKPRYETIHHYRALAKELGWVRKVQRVLLKHAKTLDPIAKNDLEGLVKGFITEPLNEAEAIVRSFPKPQKPAPEK
jgi:hypothetical protein